MKKGYAVWLLIIICLYSSVNQLYTPVYAAEGSLNASDKAESSLEQRVYEHNIEIYYSSFSDSKTLEGYLQTEVNEDIITLAEGITDGIADDYSRARAIHDWVANNIWYDWDCFYGRSRCEVTVEYTLTQRRSICEGYSNLMVALLRTSGIPAKRVMGYAAGLGADRELLDSEAENHSWVEAYVDDRWIIIDSTWDCNNKYEYGVYSDQTLCGDQYFDISLLEFSKDHRYSYYTEPVHRYDAEASSASVLLDGSMVTLHAYNIDGGICLSLRDLAYIVRGTDKQFSVDFCARENKISLTGGREYIPNGSEMMSCGAKTALVSTLGVYMDGARITLPVYNINSRSWVKPRDVNTAVGLSISWDSAQSAFIIDMADN